MNRFRQVAALVGACSIVVVACGGSDDTDDLAGSADSASTVASVSTTDPATVDSTDAPAAGTAPSTDVPADSCAIESSAPPATISPDIPEAFLDGIGPVAIEGDVLEGLPEDGDDPAIGTCAPVLIGEDFAGETVRIDASAGGRTWLIFLAHWCPHCNDEIPVINELRDAGRIPDDVNVVGVSTVANPDRPNWPPDQWLSDKDWAYLAVADGIDFEAETFIAANAFGVSAFPFSVLIDEQGRVERRWAGGRSADEIVSLLRGGLAA